MEPSESKKQNIGRASTSFRDNEAVWLAGVMTALINGRDLTRFRTAPEAVTVLRKARRCAEQAGATAALRVSRHPTQDLVLAKLCDIGTATSRELAAETDLSHPRATNALTCLRRRRLVKCTRTGNRHEWTAKSNVVQLSERKAAVR